ncbi:Sphingosine kinase 1 [Coemansia sp. RSA 1365]|nr:Sphingosine kinase 1 [Coemansia sp. RSA 1365]
MPGVADVAEAVISATGADTLLMRSEATLYSSQGMLSGLLTLYRDRLEWKRSSNTLTISMDVLFGATLSPPNKFKFKSIEAASIGNLSIKSSTHFTVYTITARESGKRPLCDTWTFMVGSEEEGATWISLLRFAIKPKPADEDTSVLVLLNPVSGKQKSLKIFETVVKPIFEIGCTPYTLKVTKLPNYAHELVKTEDLSKYSAIVAVSGDGLLHEILNGLLLRPDWAKYRNVPLGIIPTGSGNGLAKSLDIIWPEQAAVAILKAQSRPIDIMSVMQASGRTEYCFLSVTWGLLADIDIESERMRWAGAARFDLYGTLRIMNMRFYGGRLHYLPMANDEEDDDVNDDGDMEEMGDAKNPWGTRDNKEEQRGDTPMDATDALAFKTTVMKESHGQMESAGSSATNMHDRTNQGADIAWGLPAPNFSSPLVRSSPKVLHDNNSPKVQPAVTLHPTLTAGIQLPVKQGSLPPRWHTVEGPFAQVIATNVTWLSSDFMACPLARISDGAIDLVYSCMPSKWNMISYMAASSKDNYMNTEDISHVRARAFILEPSGVRTTSRNPSSLQALQPQTNRTVAVKNTQRSPSPLLSLLRSKSANRANGKKALDSILPQAPVPARVRSQVYTSYHQQTFGRRTSLQIPELGNTRDIDTVPVEAKDSTSNPIDPQAPAQALFSIRSETASALEALEQPVSTTNPAALPAEIVQPLPVTLTPAVNEIPDSKADDDSREECRLVGKHGIVDLDGEMVELGPIKVECLANLITVVTPPWFNEGHNSRVATTPATKAPESIMGTLSREGSMLSFNV